MKKPQKTKPQKTLEASKASVESNVPEATKAPVKSKAPEEPKAPVKSKPQKTHEASTMPAKFKQQETPEEPKAPAESKPPKKLTLKLFLILCATAVALIVAIVQLYDLFYYRLYRGYTKYLKSYETAAAEPLTLTQGNDVPGFELVSESLYLKLYTNTKTAEIAVFDKRNGQIAYSNPPNADDDANATALNKSYLKSQIIIDYYSARRTLGTYNSYDQAVSLSQFEYEGLGNGIRYIYTFGDFSSATGIVPVYISQERFDFIISQMSADGVRYLTGRYHPWSEREGYMELAEAARRPAQLRNMTAYLEEIGYTEDDFIADMTDSGAEDAIPLTFVVALEYRLYDDCLEVALPSKLIEESGGGMLSRVQVLRYFGAAGPDEEGYMLLPNGSGSIVYFNNGKEKTENYSQFVYGMDPMTSEYLVTEETQNARLPVFGISRPNSGIFASIEQGETLASITAYVSGAMNSYNFVYPTFILRGGERLTMFGATDVSAELPIVEADFYDVNCRVKYYFLTDEYEGYSGMANFYREKLAAEGVLKTKLNSDSSAAAADIPFYMDIAGGVQSMSFFLGTQYLKTLPMTTFSQAEQISGELASIGITNQVVNYQGWFNKGYHHDVPNKINIIGKLGGKKGLEEFTRSVEAIGGKVYGDVVFLNPTYVSKRYNYALENSRYYGAGYAAGFGIVHPVSNMRTTGLGYAENFKDLLSPKFLNRYVDKFSSRIEKVGLTGIGLRDLGDSLHSDKKRTEVIDREQAKNIVLAQFDTLKATGKDIMVTGGNLYALKYSDDLIDIPLSHNAFFMMDEEVPFYQMVVRGHINYAGASINLNSTADNRDIALRLIATGASPHYTFTYEPSSLLKKTALNHYRSTTFDNWKYDAAEVYTMVNEALRRVSGCAIIKHEILAVGVTRTTYENGRRITVNKNDYDADIDGTVIEAKSWLID